MTSDVLAAIGAFLSGVAAVGGAWLTIRTVVRRMARDCDERIELYRQGIEMGRKLREDEDDQLHSS